MRLLLPRISNRVYLALALGLALVGAAQADILAEQVAAQGLIVPKGGLVHVAAPGGRTGQAIVQQLMVSEGDQVKAGQLIAVLEGRAQAEAELAAAQAEANAAATAPAIIEAQIKALETQIDAAEAEVATAKGQVKAAEAAVAQAQSGVAQAQANAAQAEKGRREALEKLDAELAKITGTNSAYQSTLDEWDPPTREREEIKMKQKMLSEEYRAAQAPRSAMAARLDAEVAAAEAGVAAAEFAVAAAQADVEVAQSQVDSAMQGVAQVEAQRAVLEAELARAQASAEAAKAGVAQAETALSMTEVHARSAGSVLHIGARPGEAVGPMGVVTLGDLSELLVEAEVYIDDVRKVKAGQKAKIESDAFEGSLSGTVTQVGGLVNPQGVFSSDPLAYSDKRVVLATIKLDPINGWRPPVHSTVIARITVGQ